MYMFVCIHGEKGSNNSFVSVLSLLILCMVIFEEASQKATNVGKVSLFGLKMAVKTLQLCLVLFVN